MKVKIVARPGELQQRLPDVIRALQGAAGGELRKSDPRDPVQDRRELLIPALRQSTDEALPVQERIGKEMLRKMLAVLGEDA